MPNSLPRPPELASRILRFFLQLDEVQEKMGDFEEGFLVQAEREGIHRARSWYWRQLWRVIPVALNHHMIWSLYMFKNYLKITIRNLLRHKGYSFINLFGLTLGMACCLLIFLFIQSELSYDRFHEHSDRIFRVSREWFNQDGESNLHLGHVAPPIGPLLQNDFPEIERMVRILKTGDILCSHGDKHFIENRLMFADAEFFQVFSFELKKGDPTTALQEPFSVIITEQAAEKYFGTTNPMGQTLQFDNRLDAKITGIIDEAPSNSHFHYDIIGSLSTLQQIYGTQEFEDWSSNNYATYVLLPEGYDARKLSDRFPEFLNKYRGEAGELDALHLWPITSIHLHSHLDSELETNSDISSIYIFSAVGFFILLIACINFMNLSTARSSLRAKEVGMRKVVGADRMQIIRQFLIESLSLAFFSILLALAIVRMVLPSFSRFVGKELSLDMISQPFLPIMLVSIFLFVGLSAGTYPALFLSAFRPSHVLKGSRGGTGSGSAFRKTLVVFQFTISIILVISVSVVREQLHFSRSKPLGFNKEHVVLLPSSPDIQSNFESARTRILEHPGVINAAGSRRVPSGRLLDSGDASLISGTSEQPVDFRVAFVAVEYHFLETYGIPLLAGRNFSLEYGTDEKEAFILNETAVRKLGWTPEEAVGKPFKYSNRTGRVIGVMSDFHFESIHQNIAPIVLFIRPSDFRVVSVRIRPDDIPATLRFLQDKWAVFRPGYPFEYSFLDEKFDGLYHSEARLSRIIGTFSVLAIIIACLGLLGLASFTAERRTKEIGIRKVMGASTGRLTSMLTIQFTRWVLAANVVAWPIAYFLMRNWLKGFAYRIDIGLHIFILSGLAVLIVAALTVGYQSIKAALANPADTLRYE